MQNFVIWERVKPQSNISYVKGLNTEFDCSCTQKLKWKYSIVFIYFIHFLLLFIFFVLQFDQVWKESYDLWELRKFNRVSLGLCFFLQQINEFIYTCSQQIYFLAYFLGGYLKKSILHLTNLYHWNNLFLDSIAWWCFENSVGKMRYFLLLSPHCFLYHLRLYHIVKWR